MEQDANLQIRRRSFGSSYGEGWVKKGLGEKNEVKVTFPRILVKSSQSGSVAMCVGFQQGIQLAVEGLCFGYLARWVYVAREYVGGSILYRTDISYIAIAADGQDWLRFGTFGTEGVRPASSWVKSNQGTVKFEKLFITKKKPRVVVGLSVSRSFAEGGLG